MSFSGTWHDVTGQSGPSEAPAAFDDQTNGFEPQGDVNTPGTFLADKAAFEAREEVEDGLGPVYNAQSCAECHQNRVTGGSSQVMELRAGPAVPGGCEKQGRVLNYKRSAGAIRAPAEVNLTT